MTQQHPAHPTNPHKASAPLQPGTFVSRPALEDLRGELCRAEVELVYALAQHRKAWSRMRKRAETRDQLAADSPYNLPTLESDPHWKKATGDVSWWRDEVTCQATAILALRQTIGE